MAKLTRAKAAAEVMVHLCEHEAHGYSQPARKGDGTTETITLSDGSKVQLHGGDYDCSEAVRVSYAAVGVLPKESYMWTGNERDLLLKHGFEELPFRKSALRIGDVLWKEGHTEIYVGNGNQGGFNGDEKGGLGQGAKQGDQTGYESYIKPVRDYWVKTFRYREPEPVVYKEGWVQAKDGRWWYQFADGTWPTGWHKVNKTWYWFDEKGWMASNQWVSYVPSTIDGQKNKSKKACWYWVKKSGAMAYSECLKINKKWYAFRSDGTMVEKQVKLRSGGSMYL